VKGFDTTEKEVRVVQEASETHNTESTKHPDYLKVLLCEKDGDNGSQVDE
jgi:hypothetical protein